MKLKTITIAALSAFAAMTLMLAAVAVRRPGSTPVPLAFAGSSVITQPINTFSSTRRGVVPASGGGTSNFLRADGTWAAPVTVTTGSISISSAATASAVNLSTLGTIDWMWPNNSGNNPADTSNNHHKRSGGFIRTTLRWIYGANIFSQGSSTTWTSTGTDDVLGNTASVNSTSCVGFYSNGGGSDYGGGFAFYVPAVTTTRYLRIYYTWFDSNVRITASLPDGTTQTATSGQGNGERYWLVQYSGAGDLTVVVENFTSGSNTHIKLCGVSLGTT